MTSDLVRTAQEDFSAGSQRDVAPSLIDERGVSKIVNGLLDDDGSIYRRGGTVDKSNIGFGTKLTWIWDGYLKPGQRTVFANTDDFGVLAADDATPVNLGGPGLQAPVPPAVFNDLLFLSGGWLYGGSRKAAAYSTGTIALTNGSKTVTGTGTAFSTNVDAGMLLRRGSERVYIVDTVDSATQVTLRDAYEGTTGSGITYSLSPLVQATAPYETATYYAVCANRLCWTVDNKVRFGALDNPHTAFDPNNEHELPEGVRILGIATLGATLLVFSTSGIYTVSGLEHSIVSALGDPQQRLDRLNSDLILLSASGIATWENRLIVPCLDGVWLVDAVSAPTRISRPVDKPYRDYAAAGYKAGGAEVFRSHYLLPILDGANNAADMFVCRLDRPVRSRGQTTYPWTFFDGFGGRLAAFTTRSGTATPLLLGAGTTSQAGSTATWNNFNWNQASWGTTVGARVVDCSYYFQPDSAHRQDGDGTIHNLDLILRDYTTGGLTLNSVRKVRLRYELLGMTGDNPQLLLSYSSGSKITGQSTTWNAFTWNQANWIAGDETAFFAVPGSAPVSDGLTPKVWHVNKRLRFVRFRLTSTGPIAKLTIRSIELFTRPARSLRF